MNRNYHINMHSPIKLMADMSGATIEIGSQSRIHGSCLHAWASIRIGKGCLIASNCQIFDSSGHALCLDLPNDRINSTDSAKPITIEDSVWIGAHSIVLPGVTIGYGSVIGAASVVTHDIPPGVLAVGNPARPVRTARATDRLSSESHS